MNKVTNSLVFIIIFFEFYSCTNTETNPLVQQRFLLGTPLVIKIFEGGSEELLNEVYDKIEFLERTMSTSEKDYKSTEIMDINKASHNAAQGSLGVYPISKDTENVLGEALRIAKLTDGAFDPTIQPLVSLWGFGNSEEQHVPKLEEIEKAKKRVDWNKLKLDVNTHTVSLNAKQGIDVGGIAKGYGADLAKKMLIEAMVTRAIIDFGGNIILIGKKENNLPWVIGIQEPFQNIGTVLLTLSLPDEASIVTSGIYERYFEENGIRYSHIIDKKTGFPVENNLLSVSIVTKKSIEADALATGAFVLGLDKGLTLINTLDDVEAIFVTKDHKIVISQGISKNQIEIKNKNFALSDIN